MSKITYTDILEDVAHGRTRPGESEMNLKRAAIAAHQKQVDEYEAFQQERLSKIEAKIKKQLDVWGVTGATVAGDIIEIDGATLKAELYNDKIHGWSIKGACPRCGEQVWSQSTFGGDLARLGKLLTDEFRPDCDCKSVQDAPAAALLDALYDFIVDAIENGQ